MEPPPRQGDTSSKWYVGTQVWRATSSEPCMENCALRAKPREPHPSSPRNRAWRDHRDKHRELRPRAWDIEYGELSSATWAHGAIIRDLGMERCMWPTWAHEPISSPAASKGESNPCCLCCSTSKASGCAQCRAKPVGASQAFPCRYPMVGEKTPCIYSGECVG